MKCSQQFSWTSIALLGCGWLCGTVQADEKPATVENPPAQESKEEKPKEERKAEVKVIAIPATGKHWIGVQATPIRDEALKAHLDLKGDRLIVVQVVPDSPSAKAGVKQHDILVRFADKELSNLEDLVKAVKESGDKESQLEVLRAGKVVVIPIRPAAPPADAKVRAIQEVLPQDLRVYLADPHKDGDGAGRYTLRMLGPGIAAAKAFDYGGAGQAFPDGLSLSVTKENDQPAKIVAKKDGKTYETTSDKLKELPEDIRPHVERLLHAPHATMFSYQDMKNAHVDGAKIHAEVQKAVEAARQHAEEARSRSDGAAKAVRSRIEVRQGGPLDELKKEIEALKQEVNKLKDGNKDDSRKDSDKDSEKKSS